MLKRFPVGTHRIWQTTALALTVGLFGTAPRLLATTLAQAGSKPIVVATTSVLCDVTKQIAQDTVDLKCLIDAGSDPHQYQPKPEDRKAIEQAKLILYGGYNFESTIIKLIQATSNSAPKVAVNEIAVPKPQQFEEDGKLETDPHVFHNAANGAEIAKVVGKNLSQLQPSQAKFYTANTQKLSGELTQIDTWIKSQVSTIPTSSRKLVTTHDAFGYYSKAYGIPVAGALQGISTEEKPTPRRIAELVSS
ncbi:metal ABC transporter solute-binding protein, Zn/Mn family [Phormidesmis priestleyi]